jgi:hypothetical protein
VQLENQKDFWKGDWMEVMRDNLTEKMLELKKVWKWGFQRVLLKESL